MERSNLTIRLVSHIGQALQDNYIDNIYNFFHLCINKRITLNIDDNCYDRIVNVDETPIYFEMPKKKH